MKKGTKYSMFSNFSRHPTCIHKAELANRHRVYDCKGEVPHTFTSYVLEDSMTAQLHSRALDDLQPVATLPIHFFLFSSSPTVHL